MQSLEAKTKYSNSFDCAYQIFKFEGISRFWKGTTPRLIRLSLSGGIVFTVYENGESLLEILTQITSLNSTASISSFFSSDQVAGRSFNLEK
jgi:hypothetical protein